MTEERVVDGELLELQSHADALGGGQSAPGVEAPDQEKIPTALMLRPVVSMVCNMVCPLWCVPDEEQAVLCEAYGGLLDKYFPGGFKFGVEVTAIIVTATVVGPRWNMPRTEAEAEKMRQAKNADKKATDGAVNVTA